MKYFTKDIIDANWVTKKQFYKSLGCEDFTTWEIVQTRQFVWEHTQSELLAMRDRIILRSIPSIEELAIRKEQSDLQVAEINEKLSQFI